MSLLGDLYKKTGAICREQGITLDASPNGAIHQWVMGNVTYRPGTEFFIVCGIAAAMADLEAIEQGYEGQYDRAAKLMSL